MKLLVLTILAVFPATAQAATVGLEGTELVYRSAPGQADLVEVEDEAGVFTFENQLEDQVEITPGPGCERAGKNVRCAGRGVTTLRLLTADGDDEAATYVAVPVVADLGPGNDRFGGSGPSVVVAAGDGDDHTGFAGGPGSMDLGPGNDSGTVTSVGPATVEGGEGNDKLFADGTSKRGVVLSGGAGDDEIRVEAHERRPGFDVACGSGDDATYLRLADRPGDGCAAHVALASTRTVSRRFGPAMLTAPASGSVEYRHASGTTLARGTFDAPAGPLRVRLNTTKAGGRVIRREREPKVHVRIRTRAGGDRGQVRFNSTLRP